MRKKTRVRALGIGENGFRNFTNRVRPIKTPDDLKGLKIRTMENPAHMAIPLFILAGDLMNLGGVTERLVRFSNLRVGHIRGGLAHTLIVAEMFLSGVSGSAVADASALGKVLIPSMVKEG